MRLKKFSVSKLFGIFDHEINFRLEEGITIIHAPNGYGKTVVLTLINHFFSGSLQIFKDIEFNEVIAEFNSGDIVKISQIPSSQLSLDPDGSTFPKRVEQAPQRMRGKGRLRPYRIELINHPDAEAWEPYALPPEGSERRRFIGPAIERYLPQLIRVGAQEYRDRIRGDLIDVEEAYARYGEDIPDNARRHRGPPEWLETIRRSIQCQLIETQRLVTKKKETRSYDREEPPKAAVSAYRDALAARIKAVLAESATRSQSLDRTFPNRILGRMRDSSRDPFSEEELRSRLAALEQKRARLTAVDLLAYSDDSAIISNDEFDLPTQRILTEYVLDTDQKLEFYEDMLRRLELFTQLLNEKLNFKSIHISRETGFEIRDFRRRLIDPEELSSGEQHELILFFDLIFGEAKNRLILIDEPEISLHIAWQKRFIPDLQRIVDLSPMDVVISTHSPQLISHYRNLVEQFRRPDA